MNVKRIKSAPTSNDSDVLPEISDDWIAEADLYRGETLVRRGRPKIAHPRQLLTIRLRPEIIAKWKATGPGWQTRMADALEKAVR